MKYTLHLDSINSIKNNGNSFDCTFMLGSLYKNVHSITLKSCEMPVAFYNVRTPYNTLTLSTDGLTMQTVTVPEGSYTLQNLVDKLNISIPPYTTYPFSIINQSLKVKYDTSIIKNIKVSNNIAFSNIIVFDKYSNIGGSITPMYINYPNSHVSSISPDLSWFIGLDGRETPIDQEIIANNIYNFSFDNYLRVCLPFTGMSSREVAQTTFKVPINVGYGGVMIYTNTQENKQTVYINGSYNKFDRISVQIRDRFGNIISNNGVDWSLSIELDCE